MPLSEEEEDDKEIKGIYNRRINKVMLLKSITKIIHKNFNLTSLRAKRQ
jgi:hypothetical protein